MKLSDYMTCSLTQRTLLDQIQSLEQKGEHFVTRNMNIARTLRRLESNGLVVIHRFYTVEYDSKGSYYPEYEASLS